MLARCVLKRWVGRARRGGITEAGNEAVRRTLVESAWIIVFRLKSTKYDGASEAMPAEVGEITWKAQVRLQQRYKAMIARGKKPTVTVTAIARETLGFLWAMGRVGETANA
jgi:transposase